MIVAAIHIPLSRLLRRTLCHSGIFALSQVRWASVVQAFMVGRRRGKRKAKERQGRTTAPENVKSYGGATNKDKYQT